VCSKGIAGLDGTSEARADDGAAFGGGGCAPVQREGVDAMLVGVG